MSKKEKLEIRIRNNPRNVSLNDFESFVKTFGEIKEGGSHPLAIISKRVFAYRRTNPMQTPYVTKILEIIDEFKNQKE